jgi:F0F1-type ATP synthase assembly protein I
LFAYGGLWLDARFGSKPLFLLVGVVCGIVGGILHLIRVLAPEMWPFGKLPRNGDPTDPRR